jgi:hypothetical protein
VSRRGAFKPFLTSLSTSLTLGQNSAFFRWLGFGRATEQERQPERGEAPPDSGGVAPATGPGVGTATGNPQMAGGGPWSLSLTYSLQRARRSVVDLPGRFDPGNQQVGAALTFYPTKNWAVNWRTDYSISEGRFLTQVVNLKRDLYRWQANFDFTRTPNGNTSFSFSVHLIDLPDLKADYNERSIGAERTDNNN